MVSRGGGMRARELAKETRELSRCYAQLVGWQSSQADGVSSSCAVRSINLLSSLSGSRQVEL